MQDPTTMGMLDRLGQVRDQVGGISKRNRFVVRMQPFGQIDSRTERRRDITDRTYVSGFKYLDNVRVFQSRCRAGLMLETGSQTGFGQRFGTWNFERNLAAQLRVI